MNPSPPKQDYRARKNRIMTGKKIIQVLCVAASITVLVWLLHRIGWTAIGAAVSRVGWLGAAALILLAFSETSLDGAALWTVMGGPLRLGMAIAVNAAGSVLNLVLPWESGEVLKGGLLHDQFATGKAISGTILWNYVFKISRPAVSLSAALLALLFCRDVDSTLMALVIAANVMAFLPYVVLRVLVRYGAAEGLLRVLRLIPVVRRHPAHWVELARNIDAEVKNFGRDRRAAYVRVFCLQVLARLTGWASLYVVFRAMGLGYTFGQATLIYATMNVADYVIAALPARVGVSEGTAFFVFKLFELEPALGLIIYTMLRARTILANGVMTPFAFIRWKPASSAKAVGAG
jgi:hypothetical protein